jgi:chemotaxis protein MotB
MDAEQPIIVIKKKSGHGGHHGGAWKVAYADFVTAMMALFIVLWLMSSTSKQTQEEIAGYFNDPKGLSKNKGGGEGKAQVKEIKEVKEAKDKKDDMAALKKDLMKAIEDINSLNKLKKQIEMTITDEGLRIEMIEDEKGTFFESGSAQPTPVLTELLKVLSGQLKDLPNNISIEGHTDAHPYATRTNYGNWELSADRANAARRAIQEDGVRSNQVTQVRGFADQRLHFPDKPLDPGNRRVSLVVQNLQKDQKPVDAKPKGLAGELAEAIKDDPKIAVKGEAKIEPKAGGAAEADSSAMAVAPAIAAKPAAGMLERAMGMFHKK